MTSRPSIVNAPMIRALLAGEKTQTRRIVKPQPPMDHSPLVVDRFCPTVIDRYGDEQPGDEVFGVTTENGEWCLRCPYGQPGDTLWVRETWGMTYVDLVAPDRPFIVGGTWGSPARPGRPPCVVFKADGAMPDDSPSETARWTPSIHMPRWASRLTLRITDVRVQRLQEISEAEARAEGVTDGGCINCGESEPCGCTNPMPCARDSFISSWYDIHGPASWLDNPYVWALTFDVIRQNVDEVTA